MKTKTLLEVLLGLAAAFVIFTACHKDNPISEDNTQEVVPEDTPEEKPSDATHVIPDDFPGDHGTLVSSKLLLEQPLDEVLSGMLEGQIDSTVYKLITESLAYKSLSNFDIVTYEFKYKSVVRDGEGYHNDAVLTGSASFIIDGTGSLLKSRTLESVSLCHACYNTSASDVSYCFGYFRVRAIYNALVVCPYYQGGDKSDGWVVAPSEFLIKGKQALDCELAALQLVESLDGVKMASGYYTDNYGVSNGGGPALSIPYLLQNDKYYKDSADKINLSVTYIGEGNCSNTSVFPNYLAKTSTNSDSVVDMTLLAPSAYISTVVGVFSTWKDKYFQDIDLDDFFSEAAGSYVQQYMNNEGSLMLMGYSGLLPAIEETVNPTLLTQSSDGTYSYNTEEGSIINNMYEAFKENEVITSGWTPETDMLITHSTGDEFLLYEDNLKLWMNLSDNGRNSKVRFRTVYGKGHISASLYMIEYDLMLRSHPLSLL